MEIIHMRPDRMEYSDRSTLPNYSNPKLEIVNLKEETRKQQLETINWILARGYWNPDTPESIKQACNKVRKQKQSNTGFLAEVRRWYLGM